MKGPERVGCHVYQYSRSYTYNFRSQFWFSIVHIGCEIGDKNIKVQKQVLGFMANQEMLKNNKPQVRHQMYG